jgi:hypothetical protein
MIGSFEFLFFTTQVRVLDRQIICSQIFPRRMRLCKCGSQ